MAPRSKKGGKSEAEQRPLPLLQEQDEQRQEALEKLQHYIIRAFNSILANPADATGQTSRLCKVYFNCCDEDAFLSPHFLEAILRMSSQLFILDPKSDAFKSLYSILPSIWAELSQSIRENCPQTVGWEANLYEQHCDDLQSTFITAIFRWLCREIQNGTKTVRMLAIDLLSKYANCLNNNFQLTTSDSLLISMTLMERLLDKPVDIKKQVLSMILPYCITTNTRDLIRYLAVVDSDEYVRKNCLWLLYRPEFVDECIKNPDTRQIDSLILIARMKDSSITVRSAALSLFEEFELRIRPVPHHSVHSTQGHDSKLKEVNTLNSYKTYGQYFKCDFTSHKTKLTYRQKLWILKQGLSDPDQRIVHQTMNIITKLLCCYNFNLVDFTLYISAGQSLAGRTDPDNFDGLLLMADTKAYTHNNQFSEKIWTTLISSLSSSISLSGFPMNHTNPGQSDSTFPLAQTATATDPLSMFIGAQSGVMTSTLYSDLVFVISYIVCSYSWFHSVDNGVYQQQHYYKRKRRAPIITLGTVVAENQDDDITNIPEDDDANDILKLISTATHETQDPKIVKKRTKRDKNADDTDSINNITPISMTTTTTQNIHNNGSTTTLTNQNNDIIDDDEEEKNTQQDPEKMKKGFEITKKNKNVKKTGPIGNLDSSSYHDLPDVDTIVLNTKQVILQIPHFLDMQKRTIALLSSNLYSFSLQSYEQQYTQACEQLVVEGLEPSVELVLERFGISSPQPPQFDPDFDESATPITAGLSLLWYLLLSSLSCQQNSTVLETITSMSLKLQIPAGAIPQKAIAPTLACPGFSDPATAVALQDMSSLSELRPDIDTILSLLPLLDQYQQPSNTLHTFLLCYHLDFLHCPVQSLHRLYNTLTDHIISPDYHSSLLPVILLLLRSLQPIVSLRWHHREQFGGGSRTKDVGENKALSLYEEQALTEPPTTFASIVSETAYSLIRALIERDCLPRTTISETGEDVEETPWIHQRRQLGNQLIRLQSQCNTLQASTTLDGKEKNKKIARVKHQLNQVRNAFYHNAGFSEFLLKRILIIVNDLFTNTPIYTSSPQVAQEETEWYQKLHICNTSQGFQDVLKGIIYPILGLRPFNLSQTIVNPNTQQEEDHIIPMMYHIDFYSVDVNLLTIKILTQSALASADHVHVSFVLNYLLSFTTITTVDSFNVAKSDIAHFKPYTHARMCQTVCIDNDNLCTYDNNKVNFKTNRGIFSTRLLNFDGHDSKEMEQNGPIWNCYSHMFIHPALQLQAITGIADILSSFINLLPLTTGQQFYTPTSKKNDSITTTPRSEIFNTYTNFSSTPTLQKQQFDLPIPPQLIYSCHMALLGYAQQFIDSNNEVAHHRLHTGQLHPYLEVEQTIGNILTSLLKFQTPKQREEDTGSDIEIISSSDTDTGSTLDESTDDDEDDDDDDDDDYVTRSFHLSPRRKLSAYKFAQHALMGSIAKHHTAINRYTISTKHIGTEFDTQNKINFNPIYTGDLFCISTMAVAQSSLNYSESTGELIQELEKRNIIDMTQQYDALSAMRSVRDRATLSRIGQIFPSFNVTPKNSELSYSDVFLHDDLYLLYKSIISEPLSTHESEDDAQDGANLDAMLLAAAPAESFPYSYYDNSYVIIRALEDHFIYQDLYYSSSASNHVRTEDLTNKNRFLQRRKRIADGHSLTRFDYNSLYLPTQALDSTQHLSLYTNTYISILYNTIASTAIFALCRLLFFDRVPYPLVNQYLSTVLIATIVTTRKRTLTSISTINLSQSQHNNYDSLRMFLLCFTRLGTTNNNFPTILHNQHNQHFAYTLYLYQQIAKQVAWSQYQRQVRADADHNGHSDVQIIPIETYPFQYNTKDNPQDETTRPTTYTLKDITCHTIPSLQEIQASTQLRELLWDYTRACDKSDYQQQFHYSHHALNWSLSNGISICDHISMLSSTAPIVLCDILAQFNQRQALTLIPFYIDSITSLLSPNASSSAIPFVDIVQAITSSTNPIQITAVLRLANQNGSVHHGIYSPLASSISPLVKFGVDLLYFISTGTMQQDFPHTLGLVKVVIESLSQWNILPVDFYPLFTTVMAGNTHVDDICSVSTYHEDQTNKPTILLEHTTTSPTRRAAVGMCVFLNQLTQLYRFVTNNPPRSTNTKSNTLVTKTYQIVLNSIKEIASKLLYLISLTCAASYNPPAAALQPKNTTKKGSKAPKQKQNDLNPQDDTVPGNDHITNAFINYKDPMIHLLNKAAVIQYSTSIASGLSKSFGDLAMTDIFHLCNLINDPDDCGSYNVDTFFENGVNFDAFFTSCQTVEGYIPSDNNTMSDFVQSICEQRLLLFSHIDKSLENHWKRHFLKKIEAASKESKPTKSSSAAKSKSFTKSKLSRVQSSSDEQDEDEDED